MPPMSEPMALQPRLRRWVLPLAISLGVLLLGTLALLPFLVRQIAVPSFGGGSTDATAHQPAVLPDAYKEPTMTYGAQAQAAPSPTSPVMPATMTLVPGLGNGATPAAPPAMQQYQRRTGDSTQIPTAVLHNGSPQTRQEPAVQGQPPGPSVGPTSPARPQDQPQQPKRWGIDLTHAQQRQGQQPTAKQREETMRTDAAKTLLKHAVWATPAVARKTLYRQQAIPGVTIDEMVSSIPGQYKIRVSVPVFNRFAPDVELIPKDSIIIIKQERIPTHGEKRMVLAVEEIQPPTPEVISLKAAVGDKEGAAGVGGKVDNHIPELILATVISAAINIGGRLATGNPQGYQYDVSQEIVRDVGQQVSQDAKSIIDRTLRLPPTITVAAGTPVSISLHENIMFSRLPLVIR